MVQKSVTTVLILLVAITLAVSMRAQSSNPVQYYYDDAGQLTTVVDQSGNIATYHYDAEDAATASDIETVALTAGLAGTASTGDLPEKLAPDAGAYTGAAQSAANLTGINSGTQSNVCQ